MHRLILMRHAQAEVAAPTGRDRDRTLTPSGRADAVLMGAILADKGLRPDRALVSSAARTRQTWDLAHDAFGDVEVHLEDALYNASERTLRQAVEGHETEAGCLLVIAHNPGLQFLALELLNESAASPSVMERMSGGFPTAAAAVFEVDAAGRCTYDGFLTPKAFGGGHEE